MFKWLVCSLDLKCHSEWRTPNALWELVTALGQFRMLCLEALGVFGAPMADEIVRNAYVQKLGWIFYIVLQCRAFASELIRNPFRPSPQPPSPSFPPYPPTPSSFRNLLMVSIGFLI
jgi:hypothetical protein